MPVEADIVINVLFGLQPNEQTNVFFMRLSPRHR